MYNDFGRGHRIAGNFVDIHDDKLEDKGIVLIVAKSQVAIVRLDKFQFALLGGVIGNAYMQAIAAGYILRRILVDPDAIDLQGVQLVRGRELEIDSQVSSFWDLGGNGCYADLWFTVVALAA